MEQRVVVVVMPSGVEHHVDRGGVCDHLESRLDDRAVLEKGLAALTTIAAGTAGQQRHKNELLNSKLYIKTTNEPQKYI